MNKAQEVLKQCERWDPMQAIMSWWDRRQRKLQQIAKTNKEVAAMLDTFFDDMEQARQTRSRNDVYQFQKTSNALEKAYRANVKKR